MFIHFLTGVLAISTLIGCETIRSCLDDHLASVVPGEETHQGLRHLVKPVNHRLSHLDLARSHPASHGFDPLHPLWSCPPAHQEALYHQLLEDTERKDVRCLAVPSNLVIMRNCSTDSSSTSRVHRVQHGYAHLPTHIVKVTVDSLRCSLSKALCNIGLLVVERVVEANAFQPAALLVGPGKPDDVAGLVLASRLQEFLLVSPCSSSQDQRCHAQPT